MAANDSSPADPIQSGQGQIPSADQMDMLIEEYKIVQTKVDKLGEDMFKVRSWCITLFTGVAAGAKLSGSLSAAIVVLLLPIVFAFQLVEFRQRQISRRAARRGSNIEAAIRHRMRKAKLSTAFAPFLSTQLLNNGVKDKKHRTIRGWFKRKFKRYFRHGTQTSKVSTDNAEKEKITSPPPTFLQCLIAQADFHFYVAQYLIIAILLAGTFFADKKSAATFSLQIGTNSMCITTEITNIIATNFIYQSQATTNFVVKQIYTTNYLIVSIPTSNFYIAKTNLNSNSHN